MLKSGRNIALKSLQILYIIALCVEIVTIFELKLVTIFVRNTNMCKLCKAVFFPLYNISSPNFVSLPILPCSFKLL